MAQQNGTGNHADHEALVRVKILEVSTTLGALFDLTVRLRDETPNDGTVFAIAHSCREIWGALPSFYDVKVPRSEVDVGDLCKQLGDALPPNERERVRVASYTNADVPLTPDAVRLAVQLAESAELVDQNIEEKFRGMCAKIAGVRGTDYVDPSLVRRWVSIRPSSKAHVRRDGKPQPTIGAVLDMWDEMVTVLYEVYQPADIAYGEIDNLLEGNA